MNYLILSIIIGVGSLTSLVLVMIYSEPNEIANSLYAGIEEDDLVTRRSLIGASVTIQNIPSRNCFQIDDNDLRAIPNLRQIILEAKLNANYPESNTEPNGVYTGFADRLHTDKAIDLIKKYRFNATKIPANNNFNRISDFRYNFNCFFEYSGDQYWMNVDFETHYWGDGRIVQVNFTKNDVGVPVVENQNITVFTGGFNSTVVFNNHLEHEITLLTQSPEYDGSELGIEKQVRIPPGKVWSNYLRNWSVSGDVIYKYFVKPDNLEGTIILKHYPPCMTENEVKSLYSEVQAYPKFPTYLPAGYSLECGVHNTNWAVNLVYLDENGRKMMSEANEPVSHFNRGSLNDANALIISYWNGYVANNWQKDPIYDKFESQKNASGFGSKPITIAGEPAVLYTDYYPGRRTANTLEIFTDNAITYTITGNFTDNELVKVAESLFAK